jgi:hypothetical protein
MWTTRHEPVQSARPPQNDPTFQQIRQTLRHHLQSPFPKAFASETSGFRPEGHSMKLAAKLRQFVAWQLAVTQSCGVFDDSRVGLAERE